jgi:hypothetical protein
MDVLSPILIFIGWFVLCGAVGKYAENKGRNGIGIFFLSFFLSPLVGFVVALAMSPNEKNVAAAQGKKRCPECAEFVQPDAKICRFCQHKFTEAEQLAATRISTGPPCPICGKATASLILGLFAFLPSAFLAVEGPGEFLRGHITADFVGSLCFAGAAGLLTVIYGHRARASIRRSGGRLLGKGMASGGLVLGYLGLAVGFAALVEVISLLAWIVPARILAFNQAVAVGSLQEINQAAITYASMYDRGFPSALAVLRPPINENANPTDTAAGLIYGVEAMGTKAGYRLTYIAGPVDSAGRINTYTLRADPVGPGVTAKMHYFTDQSGVIRGEKGKEANQNSAPIAG